MFRNVVPCDECDSYFSSNIQLNYHRQFTHRNELTTNHMLCFFFEKYFGRNLIHQVCNDVSFLWHLWLCFKGKQVLIDGSPLGSGLNEKSVLCNIFGKYVRQLLEKVFPVTSVKKCLAIYLIWWIISRAGIKTLFLVFSVSLK